MLTLDLDWVLLKCLEKDRERRYETANALAMELRRYLANEPVQAGPPSVRYRLGKFTSRHHVGVLLIGSFALAIVTIAVLSSVGYVRVQRAEHATSEALAREKRALGEERKKTEELNLALADIQSYVDADRRRGDEQAGLFGDWESDEESERLLQLVSDSRVDFSGFFENPHRITVHHSGISYTEVGLHQTLEHIRKIRTSHVLRGWFDIGYHFIIDPAGRVWSGRSLLEQGAHVKDGNAGNIGILVLGDFYAHPITPESAEATRRLLSRLCDMFSIPVSEVRTHREINATRDPGPPLQNVVETFRETGPDDRAADGFEPEPPTPRFVDATDLESLVEDVFVSKRKDHYFVGLMTRRAALDRPFVGRIEIHLVDRSGAASQDAEFTAYVVALPDGSAIWASWLGENGLPESVTVHRDNSALAPGVCQPLPVWMADDRIDRSLHSDVRALLAERTVARIEIIADPALATALRRDGFVVPDDATQHPGAVYRVPLSHRGELQE